MSRGVEGRSIFLDGLDRAQFMTFLIRERSNCGINVLTYCLMGNHFHLLVRVGELPLGVFMHNVLTAYATYFNGRHQRQGHLFQSRYTAIPCKQDAYLHALFRYIHMNPVRAGFVSEPADWLWSGHRGLLGLSHDPLLDIAAVSALCSAPIEEVIAGLSSGSHEELSRDVYLSQGNSGRALEALGRPSLEGLIKTVAYQEGIKPTEITSSSRRRPFANARREFIRKAVAIGYGRSEIARALGRTPGAITNLLNN